MTKSSAFSLLNKDIHLCVNPSEDRWIDPSQFSLKDSARYATLTNHKVRERFIQSRSALDIALGNRPLQTLEFNHKKPVHPDGFVSLSHCSEGAAAIFSEKLEVGIDLESSRAQIVRIGHKFTCEDEKSQFEMPEQDQLQFIWGIKESLFKLYGYGNVDFKKHLHINSVQWNPLTAEGWGIAWVTQTCQQRPQPIQCLVQFKKIENLYLCIATHRKPLVSFESKRLRLREWNQADATWLRALNANPNVIFYTGDTGFTSKEKALELIQTYPNYQRDGYGRWIVCLKENNTPIGWCGLKSNPWGIDLGFRFLEEYWGQGYGYEAAKRVVDWARSNGIKRLIGRTLSGNSASIRILEKVGMRHFQEVSIEEFAQVHSIEEPDLKRWSDQSLKNYNIDL